LKPATPGGEDLLEATYDFVASIASGRVEEFAAIVEEVIGPQRHVGVLQPAPDIAVDAGLRVGEFLGECVHLVEGLGHLHARLRENLLVVIEDEVID